MPLIDYYGPQGWGGQEAPLRQRQHVATELISTTLGAQPDSQPTVLDVGCGDGSFLAHLASMVPVHDIRWIGVDYSEHQLAKAGALYAVLFVLVNAQIAAGARWPSVPL